MDLDYVESLAELVNGTRVCEVTVRAGKCSVTIRRGAGTAPAPAPVPALVESTAIRPAPREAGVQLPTRLPSPGEVVALGDGEAAPVRFEIIRAHRVGVFHRGGEASGEPLVAVGDWAAAGQQLGSIESMRVYDEVDNTVGGRVVGVFVPDGAPVEYGQPLYHIQVCDDPDAALASGPLEGEAGA